MKTLKFMLAAATAIGLASAYAEPDAGASTGFEGITLNTKVVTGMKDDGTLGSPSFFYYAGDVEEDNDSTIISLDGTGPVPASRPRGATGRSSNILQVSTGEKPLLRTFQSLSGGKPQDATGFTQDVYVDTLVQFTVTPYTDKVTPGESDKLMIYLKECTNTVGVVEGTNLVVVGKYCVNDGEFEPLEYKVQNVAIDPGTWYRLTVKAIADFGKEYIEDEYDEYHHPAFSVYINGTICTFDELAAAGSEDTDSGFVDPFGNEAFGEGDLAEAKIVFSLMCTGSEPATLQAVGFAGEGKVDDLMITSGLDPFATVYDFTFAYDTDKITAVSYTVGGQAKDQAVTNMQVEDGTQIVINMNSTTFASNYEFDSITAVGLREDGNNTFTVTNNATLTIVAREKQSAPLEPGEQDPTIYTTPEAAATAAGAVVIAVPSAVSTAFGDDAAKTAAYKALFAAKVVPNTGVEGGYKVEVGLTAAAEATLQDQVDEDAAAVIADLSEEDVTLTTTPGLYYSFEYGTTLENMTEGDRTLATGATLTLDRPTTEDATAGFYKVLVNVTDK